LTLNFFAQGGFTETTYKIPDNINAIKESAFRCSNINSIKINSDLSTIGDYAFEGCKYLTSIDNWDNVKMISNGTFKNCESLNKISLPSKLTSIGKNAFEKCIKMYIDTNIPDSVTYIGEYAFSECSNFRCVDNENKEVTLNLGQIECINKYTFYKCRHLSKVNINEKIKTIDSFAFCMSNNGGVISPILEGNEQPEVQLAMGINYLSIPINSKLKEINESAFENCKNLNVSGIFLPNTLTTIGNNAFKNCTQDNTNITLKIPNNVETLGHSCFSGIGIEELDMSKTSKLTIIPYSAFENCKNLKLITFSSNASKIDIQSDAFSGCENLCKKDGKLILPNNITMINERAFAGCNYISRIELPTKLQVLGHECFKTSSKKSIYIKSNISQIPVFWKDGIGDLEYMDIIIGDIESKSSPFCNLEGEISKYNINIYIPYDLLNKFKENKYWAKYNSCMIGSYDFKDSNSGGGGNDNPNIDNFDDTIKPDAKI
jgi:hypothetical protein